MAQQDDGIEDVLSSVRRLVANDAGAAQHRPAREAAAARAPMLLLGPACRVTEVEDPFQMIRSLAQEEEDAREARALLGDDGPEDAAQADGVLRLLPMFRTDAEDGADGLAGAARSGVGVPGDVGVRADVAGHSDAAVSLDDAQQSDATVPRDMAARSDVPVSLDMAAPSDVDVSLDMGVSSELATPSNIAVSSDIAVPSDLAVPTDNAVPFDMAATEADSALRARVAEAMEGELAGETGQQLRRIVRQVVREEVRRMLAAGAAED